MNKPSTVEVNQIWKVNLASRQYEVKVTEIIDQNYSRLEIIKVYFDNTGARPVGFIFEGHSTLDLLEGSVWEFVKKEVCSYCFPDDQCHE